MVPFVHESHHTGCREIMGVTAPLSSVGHLARSLGRRAWSGNVG